MVGQSQICERDGRMLAYLGIDDGEGYVAADVTLADPQPLDPVPNTFWMPVLPASFHAVWATQNLQGRIAYRNAKRRGRFGWQGQPESEHDLPDYVPPPVQEATELLEKSA